MTKHTPIEQENERLKQLNSELLEKLKDCLFHLQGYLVQHGHLPTMTKKVAGYKSAIQKATGSTQ